MLRRLALLAAACAVIGLSACGGSDDEADDGGGTTTSAGTTTTQTVEPAEIEIEALDAIRDCLVDEGLPEPLAGKKPPGRDDVADGELVFNAGNNNPVFVIYYETAERAAELAPNVEREAKRLKGEYVLPEGDNVGVLYVRTPADVRERVEGCVRD